MLEANEIRQIVEDAVARRPMVQGVWLASALRTSQVELLIVLGTGRGARRMLLNVSRLDRCELERSLDEALRRAGAELTDSAT